MTFYLRKNSSHIIFFDSDFNADSVQSWLRRNQRLPYYSVMLYIVSIYFIQQIMKTKKALDLKTPLALWNAFLACFSIYVTCSGATRLYPFLKEYGLSRFLCDSTPTRSDAILVLLGVLFLFSKFLEFGDTLFIVLRKRELIFLHWYHHVTVAVLAWETGIDGAAYAQLAVIVNGFVHSWMYSYFALKSLGYKIPKFASIMLTGLQILQLLAGVSLGLWLVNKVRYGVSCEISDRLFNVGIPVMGTYLFLFVKFFWDNYIVSGRKNYTHEMRTKSD